MKAMYPLPCGAEFHVTDAVKQSRRLGIIGSAVGLLALLVSALTYLLPDAVLHKPVHPANETDRQQATERLNFRIKRFELKVREATAPR